MTKPRRAAVHSASRPRVSSGARPIRASRVASERRCRVGCDDTARLPLRGAVPMIRTVLAALVIALLVVTPAAAFHRKTHVLVQITGDGGGAIADAHWSGFRYVLFDSDANLTGNGNTTRQVFLYDLHEHDLTGDAAIYQVTAASDDNRRGDTGIRAHEIVYDARPG